MAMNPKCAKKEEDILATIAEWEDQYDEGIKMGMVDLPDMHKIAILEDMLPPGPYSIKERLENEFHTEYIKAREQVLKWARDKFSRHAERGKFKRNSNAMDVDGGPAKALEEGPEQSAGGMDAFGKDGGKKGGGKGAYSGYGKGPNSWQGPYHTSTLAVLRVAS